MTEEAVGGNSLNGFGMKNYTSLKVETKKLDDYGFTDIDHIKIDV